RAGFAERAGHRPLADQRRDALAGKPHVVDERREIARRIRMAALLLDQKARHLFHGIASRCAAANTRLARMSAAPNVTRSLGASRTSRSANNRLACRRRARSSALRIERAFAK